MRSICRGPWPTGKDGHPQSFDPYDKAKIPLIERIGEYCSYCERTGDLHLEHVVPQSVAKKPKHVVPQSLAKKLKTDWGNFLLGCTNCNGRKSDKNESRKGYLWPDQDDTFRAFTYQSGGRVSVAVELEPDERCKAEALFNLVGLGAPDARTNRRRHKRRQAWDEAMVVRDLVNGENSRQLAIKVALRTGFFSVWMTVFCNDEDMCRRLKQAFPGTRITSDSPEQGS